MFSLYLSFITQLLNILYLCHKSNKLLHASFILMIYFANSVYAAISSFQKFTVIVTLNLCMVYLRRKDIRRVFCFYTLYCQVYSLPAVKMISDAQFETTRLAIGQIAMLKAFLEKPVRGMDLLKFYSLDRKYWKFPGGHREIVRIYSRK